MMSSHFPICEWQKARLPRLLLKIKIAWSLAEENHHQIKLKVAETNQEMVGSDENKALHLSSPDNIPTSAEIYAIE